MNKNKDFVIPIIMKFESAIEKVEETADNRHFLNYSKHVLHSLYDARDELSKTYLQSNYKF